MFEAPDSILPRTLQVIRGGITQNLHLGMQLYLSLKGEVVIDFAIGQNERNQTLTSQVLSPWLSSGKPLTAAAALQFVERHRLELESPVARYIPGFAANGKSGIRVAHLLTHTAGLRPVSSGWPHKSCEEILEKIYKNPMRREWVPGEKAAYDPGLSWFVLGEILHRIDGREIDQIVRQDLLEPLGMVDSWMTIPKHLHAAYGERIGILYYQKDQELHVVKGHELAVCLSPSPGGSMRGPISQLGLFYEMLLNEGQSSNGEQILSAQSVKLMTSRQRVGMFDQTFQHKVDWGYGIIVNSNQYGAETVPYGFGRHASENTFGHGGAQSSIGFADPQHQLVVAAVANGCPGEELHNERFRELNSAIYEDLGLLSQHPEQG